MTALKFSELLLVPDLKESVTTIVDTFKIANKPYRQRKIPEWRKAELYWSGIQRLWWSDYLNDWCHPSIAGEAELADLNMDMDERTVNIYRGHGESIIAALSSSAPGVRFFPNDAEDEDDIRTAAAYSKIADIIRRQSEFSLLYIKALFILYHQDYIVGYVYNEQHEDYGYRKEERFGKVEKLNCPECGSQMEEGVCLECDYDGPSDDITEVDEVVGYDEVPRTRTMLDVYGGTHIDIIPYARKQRDLPYLFLTSDVHHSAAVAAFGENDEELQTKLMGGAATDGYEREARLPVDTYTGEDNETVEIRECWVRPWAYYILGNDKMDRLKELKAMYPDGLKATFVNEELVKLQPSKLDDHWVIAVNPLSNSLIGDSLGKGLLPLQEMSSELNELTMQTIEHGIPMEYADPEVIDFNAVNDQDQSPGYLYPASPRGNRSLRDSFHTSEKATISREIAQFNNYLTVSAQFVTGDVPAVHGGSSAGSGSRTASEYAQSKQSALQRLGTNHRFLTHWSANLFHTAARMYVERLEDDEKFVTHKGGSYFNVWIRQKDIQGTIGHVEPIGAETLPSGPDQIKETVLRMLELRNPKTDEILFAPENTHILAQALGFSDLTIPGEDDRTKQWSEIHRLVSGEPTMGQDGQEVSSVPIDPLLDSHIIEASICASFLKSAEGQDLKDHNPQGYQNVPPPLSRAYHSSRGTARS